MRRGAKSAFKALSYLAFAVGIPVGFTAYSEPVTALDFSCPAEIKQCSISAIWITGEVRPGDAHQLAAVLRQRGPVVADAILADSVGGSGPEAWKIGRLLRRLHIVTSLGWAVASNDAKAVKGTSSDIFYPAASVLGASVPTLDWHRSVCASACVDIWLGGYYRFGNAYLAIHAPAIDSEDEHQSDEDRAIAFKQGMSDWSAYLNEMGIPPSLIEDALHVPNDQFEILSRSYVERFLLARSFSDEAWLMTHCGSAFPGTLEVWRGDITMRSVAKLSQCIADALRSDRVKAWADQASWNLED